MPSRWFVGNGTNWSSTASWSSVGPTGPSGAAVPTAADDVFLTASSPGNLIIDTTATCLTLDCTGFTKTLSHSAAGNSLTIAGLLCKLVSTMTYSNAPGAGLNFSAASGTVLITTGGRTIVNAETGRGLSSSTATYQLQDTLTMVSGSIWTHTCGTFDSNNQTMNLGQFKSANSNTRTVLFGSSAISCVYASGNAMDFSTSTGLTLTAGTSTITVSGNGGTMRGMAGQSNVVFNNVVFNGAAGAFFYAAAANITINATCLSMTWTGTTVSGTLTANAGSTTSRTLFSTGHGGMAQATITAAAVALSYVDFQCINGAGAATWSGTSLGDCGYNNNITFPAPVDRYWVAYSGGGWNTTNSWSTDDGGAAGASIPLPHDRVHFTSKSITSTGKTISINMRAGHLDFSAVLNSPAIVITMLLYGNLNLTGCTSVTSGISLQAPSACTLTTSGLTMGSFSIQCPPGGGYTLQDDLTSTGTLTISNGTFSTNDKAITCVTFNAGPSGSVRTINLGSSTITCSAAGTTAWDSAGYTSLTLNAGTSTIIISGVAGRFSCGNGTPLQIFNNLVFNVGSGTQVAGTGGCVINNLTINGSASTTGVVTFTQGYTTSVLGTLTIAGNSPTNFLTVRGGSNQVATIHCANPPVLSNVQFQYIILSGPANLYCNPSFENDFQNFAAGGFTLARTTDQKFDGAYSLSATQAGASAFSLYRNVNPSWDVRGLTPGVPYTFSIYVRAATTPRAFNVGMYFTKADGTNISGIGGAYVSDSTSAWTRISVSATAPANTYGVRCYIGQSVIPAAGEVHYFDGFQLTQTAAPVPYDVPSYGGTNLSNLGGNSGIAFAPLVATAVAAAGASMPLTARALLSPAAQSRAAASAGLVPFLAPSAMAGSSAAALVRAATLLTPSAASRSAALSVMATYLVPSARARASASTRLTAVAVLRALAESTSSASARTVAPMIDDSKRPASVDVPSNRIDVDVSEPSTDVVLESNRVMVEVEV